MVITIFDSLDQMAVAVADLICDAIATKPTAVLGLAAGRTPLPLYGELRRRYTSGAVDFCEVTTFNLDEFSGVAPTTPGSFRRFMEESFFSGVNIPAARIHFLNGLAADPAAECLRYESAIAAVGGLDIQLLGIGTNGHIGFNEPGEELVARTHQVTLLPATRLANATFFGGDVDSVPASALTMGIGTILGAREVVLMASGERKASCVARMVEGGITPRVPASILQLHRRVQLFLDRSAASQLT